MNIPVGNSKEDFIQRKYIISQVFRQWTDNNPDKKTFNPSLNGDITIRFLSITKTNGPILHHSYGQKKRNRQVDSLVRGLRQILDV